MPDGLTRRSPNAERQYRRRERAKRGEIVVPTVIGGAVLNTLVELRWLADGAAGDRAAVGDAISRMLNDLAKHR